MPFINNNDRWSISRKYAEDIHHIFSRWEWGSNHEDNKTKLYIPVHQARHRLTGNKLIKTSLLQILKINQNALTDEFIRDYKHLLSEDDLDYYYKPTVRK